MTLSLCLAAAASSPSPRDLIYYGLSAFLAVLVLVGISRMSKVERAVSGNLLGAFAMLAAVVLTLWYNRIFTVAQLWIGLLLGTLIGLFLSVRVRMIEMPQTVGILNGFGGAASMIVGLLTLAVQGEREPFPLLVAGLAVFVGGMTFSGSVVAAGKLAKWLPQAPLTLPRHPMWTALTLVVSAAGILLPLLPAFASGPLFGLTLTVLTAASLLFGILLAIRVGGADMPITISLLNSFSGVAGSIAGLAIKDPLLVAVGGIVGASGLLLTQIMCRAMNRNLGDILLGKTSVTKPLKPASPEAEPAASRSPSPLPEPEAVPTAPSAPSAPEERAAAALAGASSVIIVPGYGMALAQAQQQVKQLTDQLESMGKTVDFAIHPVAGRMPGHMNVLLAEVDIPYEKLLEMDEVNPRFAETDCVLVIGANDVINPAANTAEGTPIYGMPVLDVAKARHIVILNFDRRPGYAGVENPLYDAPADRVTLVLGDAKESLSVLSQKLGAASPVPASGPAAEPDIASAPERGPADFLREAKSVIIVPGYGMALAQAQQQVKQLTDQLESMGKTVDFAIHPVAGRMPGHMNVLLAEVDIPYEKLLEMDEVNPRFAETDCVLVIGANDVINPAANTAEGTPIYGMPVLDVTKARHIIILNFDRRPGYAGVENPLYDAPTDQVTLVLGDAKDSLEALLRALQSG